VSRALRCSTSLLILAILLAFAATASAYVPPKWACDQVWASARAQGATGDPEACFFTSYDPYLKGAITTYQVSAIRATGSTAWQREFNDFPWTTYIPAGPSIKLRTWTSKYFQSPSDAFYWIQFWSDGSPVPISWGQYQ
jgi:hypothetical protein